MTCRDGVRLHVEIHGPAAGAAPTVVLDPRLDQVPGVVATLIRKLAPEERDARMSGAPA